MSDLHQDIKLLIIDALGLEDITRKISATI